MILDEKIITTISHMNIEYYKSIGYVDIKCNQKIEIPISDLPIESGLKVNVKCDICGVEKLLAYQKYNKNIRKYNIYTCNTSCSQFKNKLTLKELYGSENFNRSEENKLKIKEKYDKITEEIENMGYIKCSKCGIDHDLSNYIKNTNGRYKKVCRNCRSKQVVENRRKKDMTEYYKKYYKNNIHIFAWRNLLKNYLNRKDLKKDDSTYKLLGYTHIELRYHLESLFTSEMNWSNYGSYWQIDHIIPISLFLRETPIDVVNSLINLRPLLKDENNKKSNKLDESSLLIIENFKQYLKK
jgi:5-methylcytosine-specific restriction endonuclease McrA